MKVLFAVSNEEISESIVKKYQKEYKQIISYKNVYYFNAILKELQKDKTYDRIVISEDLEAFTNTQYDQIDKFIFEKLDSISDEASNIKGNDIPIILICSDRRDKSEEILVKLFGIGVYNAIIGTDRSVDEVCRLINRPRVKKEAKAYYKIDTEDVNYQAENENDVSEMEIQNIIAHYKRLGKNEDRYVDSFNNIAAQYNDTQLRIISKFLPLNVRAVLEEKSPKYQQIMSFNSSVSNNLRYQNKKEEKEGPSEKLLMPKTRDKAMSKPVVIPSAVNMNSGKKLARHKQETEEPKTYVTKVQPSVVEEPENSEVEELVMPEQEKNVLEVAVEPVKRGRGRPKKDTVPVESKPDVPTKKRRGRPRKNPLPEEQIYEEENNVIEPDEIDDTTILPGFEMVEDERIEEPEVMMPGFEEPIQEISKESEQDTYLPGFEEEEEPEPIQTQNYQTYNNRPTQTPSYQTYSSEPIVNPIVSHNNQMEDYEPSINLSSLLTSDKKVVSFVGTSKNGTSFIVNNIAELLSSIGVNTAILDTTRNRNSYYIYTKNEEQLRNIAAHSIGGLIQGTTQGISVNKNLTVYTALPNEDGEIGQVDKILETLVKNYSLVLIDTDFETPVGYFRQSQEIYLVQTLDVLTIQPLTAFLRELKAKNILEEKKLRIILNKAVKIRGITEKTIIGGMAYYNDPAMSFMTELFDRNLVKYVTIPFEEEIYTQYLESIINCNISLKGYSKGFMQTLRELGNMIYPVGNSKNGGYRPPSAGYGQNNTFSPSMNSTLDQMKRNF